MSAYNHYKYIFIDLDNTLLDNLGSASEPVEDIVSYASRNNMVVYIATARGLYFAEKLSRGLGQFNIGYVCYDGAYAVNERHAVIVDEFVGWNQLDNTLAVLNNFWKQGKLFCSTKENIYAAKDTLSRGSSLRPFLKIVDSYPADQHIYQLYFRDLDEHDALAVQKVLDQYGMFSYSFQSSRQGFGILVNHGTNKAQAIRKIVHHDGNSLSDCIVVGDGTNDIAMFNLRDAVKIAAPKAVLAIKQRADYSMRNDELVIDAVKNVVAKK